MNNRQLFVSISELLSERTASQFGQGNETKGVTPGIDVVTRTRSFTVGDLGKYMTFTVTYTIYTDTGNIYNNIYDTINSGTESGSGFNCDYFHKSFVPNESLNGPAFYGFTNVQMSGGDTNVLYDIGVAVGYNKAVGVCKTSPPSGGNLFWYFFNAFFP